MSSITNCLLLWPFHPLHSIFLLDFGKITIGSLSVTKEENDKIMRLLGDKLGSNFSISSATVVEGPGLFRMATVSENKRRSTFYM